MKFLPENWQDVFIPEYPLVELIVRGIILYFFILFMLRILTRRTTGELTAMDLVFILLLTEAAAHSLGDYTTVGDGIVMLIIFLLCNHGVNQLTYHSKFFQRIFEHPPLLIIKEGNLNLRNMRKELLTKDELMTHLRENGIENISDIKKAFVEGDGNISFVQYEKNKENGSKTSKDKPK
ncbi:YetF domain-containing protein [uncultured Proteiniphilum sp.]|uniref:DUF421 domain-containing protein n=1 Tax=uncultured Proteiniphilum sp. TaxID=497637 RepID=UPI00261BEC2D|nr:YetF domain-containing protein [uncultured Proteiniphilum sp.]